MEDHLVSKYMATPLNIDKRSAGESWVIEANNCLDGLDVAEARDFKNIMLEDDDLYKIVWSNFSVCSSKLYV